MTKRVFLALLIYLTVETAFGILPGTGLPEDSCDPDAQRAVTQFLTDLQSQNPVLHGGEQVITATNVYKQYLGPCCTASVTVTASSDVPRYGNYGYGSAQFEVVGPHVVAKDFSDIDDGEGCTGHRGATASSQGDVDFVYGRWYVLGLTVFSGCGGGTTTLDRLAGVVICQSDPGCVSCGTDNRAYSSQVALTDNSLPAANFAFGMSDSRATEDPKTGLFTMTYDNADTNLFSPQVLQYLPRSPDVETIVSTNVPAYIRQVKATDGLADIVVVSTNQYELRFYNPTNVLTKDGSGLWQVTNSPMRTVTFLNSNAGTTNTCDLLIITSEGGTSLTNHYCWVPTNSAWTLDRPDGLSQHAVTCVLTNSGTFRIDSHVICDTNSGAISLKEIRKYTNFVWGTEMVERVTDPASAMPGKTYEYYTSTNDYGYSKLKRVTSPGSNWVYYTYDSYGRNKEVFRSFQNQAFTTDTNLCRYTWYDYALLSGSGDAGANTNELRTKVDFLLGKEIGRSYWVFLADSKKEIRCASVGAAWNNTNNLVTTTRYYTNGSFNGWIASVLYPNGAFTLNEYATNGTLRTNVVWYGQPGANFTNVIDGTKTVTVLGAADQTLSNMVYDVTSGILISQETFSNFDGWNRPGRVTHLDGTYEDMVYDCCGLESLTDRDGVTTGYSYDSLKRRTLETRNSISQLYSYDANNRRTRTQRQGTDSTTVTLNQTSYDFDGRIQYQTNALGGITSFTYATNASGQLTTTMTNADGGTRIELYYADGRLAKVTGTAVSPLRYDYGVESEGGVYRPYSKEIKLDSGFSDTSEWVKTYTDLLGRAYKTVYASASGTPNTQSSYNNLGQLEKTVDPDSVTNLLGYNAKGEQEFTAIDLDNNGQINTNTIDRVTRTISDIITNSVLGANVRRTRTFAWATNNSTTSTLISSVETSVDGLTTWRTVWNSGVGVTNKTQTVYAGSGNRYVTNTAPDNSYRISAFSNGRLASETRKNSANSQILKTSFGYDTHGRQNTVIDARNGTTTFTFNNNDQVGSTISPSPGNGQSGQTMTTYYDSLGRSTGQLLPDGTTTTNLYHITGLLKLTSGSRTYPVGYGYDAQGRMTTMTNWSSFNSGGGTRVTTWNYDVYRGWLTNKVYDGGVAGPIYSNTPAGRLVLRRWARGIDTTFSYNSAGDVSGIDYSDSTPDVTYTYDRRGRRETVACNGMTTTLAYNDAGQLLVEVNSGGTLNGLAVTNAYDSLLRRTAVALDSQTSTLNQFGYDTASRLSSITNGLNVATYTYLANSPLISQIVFKTNGTTRMTTTKSYDFLNRLSSISSAPSSSSAVSFSYSYNSANQRTRRIESDASYWVYQYDSLGQVTSGKKYWSDGTPVPGQQFEYAFDDIGNRTSTKAGGDAVGASLRSASYYANNLNQYTNRTVPNGFDVIGASHATNSVMINGSAADYRRGEYFHELVSVVNSSTSVWQTVSVTNSGGGSATGSVFLAATPETLGYDPDGNMTNDGRWNLTWDAENRLINLTSLSTTPSASRLKLDFEYDCKGRRVQKIVSAWNGSAYVAQSTNKFLYDGWNLLTELNNVNGLIRSYVWGLDLSGSQQGAGGAGGLLQVSYYSSQTTNCFVVYDGNGNVAALVNAGDGSPVANFEYGPFGEGVRKTGLACGTNPFRFATKYQDDENDLLYYGHRYYNSSVGHWPSRDPVMERGFRSLRNNLYRKPNYEANSYEFVNNDAISFLDNLGLAAIVPTGPATHCADPCGDAKANGLNIQGGQYSAGGVICCGGNKYVCVWATAPYGKQAGNPDAQNIISACVVEHETSHLDQIDCPTCWKRGFPTRPYFRNLKDQYINECAAFKIELNCLQSKIGSCNGDPDCETQVNLFIRNALAQIQLNCPH